MNRPQPAFDACLALLGVACQFVVVVSLALIVDMLLIVAWLVVSG